MRDDGQLEKEIETLLADPQYAGHPLHAALEALFARYHDGLTQLEKLTSISDGYQSVLRQRNQTLAGRYEKQLRQLQKIVRISDHYQDMLRDLNDRLQIASTQDPLTGLANRRLMMERLVAETALCERRGQLFSIALVDVDHFKNINDEFGHDAGDRALKSIAQALVGALRPYDICARWGGEEFFILLPETDGPTAQSIAERLRETIATLHGDELPPGASCAISVGVAEHEIATSLEHTIKRADDALYEAKRTGRNRVVVAA